MSESAAASGQSAATHTWHVTKNGEPYTHWFDVSEAYARDRAALWNGYDTGEIFEVSVDDDPEIDHAECCFAPVPDGQETVPMWYCPSCHWKSKSRAELEEHIDRSHPRPVPQTQPRSVCDGSHNLRGWSIGDGPDAWSCKDCYEEIREAIHTLNVFVKELYERHHTQNGEPLDSPR